MSWKTVGSRLPQKPAVSVAIVQQPGPPPRDARCGLRLSVTVRGDLVEGVLSWWRAEQSLTYEIGCNEHEGQIRLAPDADGPHKVSRRGGAPGAPDSALLLLPPGVEAVQRSAQPAFFVEVEGSLVITLPVEWRVPARDEAA